MSQVPVAPDDAPDPEIAALQAALSRMCDDIVHIAKRLAGDHDLSMTDALKATQIGFNVLLTMPPSPFDAADNLVQFPQQQEQPK